MKKIAVLCPSRYRPDLLEQAVKSWENNSVCSDIFFAFQSDDPHLAQNKRIAGDKPYIVTTNVGLCSKMNLLTVVAAKEYDYDAYLCQNDDQIVHTPGWDKILLDKLDELEAISGHRLWILKWRDGIQDDGGLPQGFATRELLEFTKTWAPVGYMRHSYVDNYYKFIGDGCKLQYYVPEVYIEHRHGCVGKIPKDQNYHEVISGYPEGQRQFEKWVAEKGNSLVADINKKLLSIEVTS